MNGGAIIISPKPALLAEDCCGRCKHAHAVFGSHAPTIYCRRFPPVPFPIIAVGPEGPTQAGTVSNFPSVLGDMTCGEFKRKIHHGHTSAG